MLFSSLHLGKQERILSQASGCLSKSSNALTIGESLDLSPLVTPGVTQSRWQRRSHSAEITTSRDASNSFSVASNLL